MARAGEERRGAECTGQGRGGGAERKPGEKNKKGERGREERRGSREKYRWREERKSEKGGEAGTAPCSKHTPPLILFS